MTNVWDKSALYRLNLPLTLQKNVYLFKRVELRYYVHWRAG